MQLTRCPICHSRISLDQLIQDQAGRDLLALVAKLDKPQAMALVGYIGLFRSNKRDLANDRALRLANEALALGEPLNLTVAMSQTVEQMRQKAQQGAFKPLNNHNYLKRVLEDTHATAIPAPMGVMPENTGLSVQNSTQLKRKQLTDAVLDVGNTDW